MMNLVINAVPLLGDRSGVGRYAWEIASRLKPDEFTTTCFYGCYSGGLSATGTPPATIRWLERLKAVVGRHAFVKRGAKALAELAARLRNKEYNLYFEPNFILQPGIRARHRVITVHDFSCLRYPQWHPVERVRHFEANLLNSLAQADRIITVSEAVRREAVEDFGLPADRVVTICNGVDGTHYSPPSAEHVLAVRRRWNLPERFVLFVGTLEPRKNLHNLLLAHDALPARLRNRFPLVIAGGKGWEDQEILQQIRNRESNILQLGFIADADLPALYGAAALLAYPSWYEGFGLPVLEAMACGCPVVTSTAPSILEVSGDAALCVAPEDHHALSLALATMLEDEDTRTRCIQAGLRRAGQFTWDASARGHADLFHAVCEGQE